MVFCVGYMGRLGTVGLRSMRPVLGTSQLRCLSTIGPGLQHSRLLPRGELRSVQLNTARSLSLWGWGKATPVSSPAPAAASAPSSETSSISEEPTPVPESAPAPPEVSPETSAAVDPVSALPADVALPPVPTDPLPLDLASTISPLNYGDLAALGLAGWTPAGIARWSMELINVSTGLPWAWTIVATTVLSRVLLFPFTVKQMQSTAALAPYQKDIESIRDEMSSAQQRKDVLAMQRAALRQKVVYEKAGVSLGGMALAPFIQLPVTLGMFFGVKAMCDLPVEQLKLGGFGWFTDLTLADPTWTLPIVATLLMNVQISVSMRDLVGTSAQMGHIMNALRVLTTGSVFLMSQLSTGVLFYLLTSITAMTAQSLILRQPAVRRALGIPLIPAHLRQPAPTMRESLQYARQWWSNKVSEARTAQREINRR